MEPWKIIKMRHGRKSIGNTGQLAYFTKWGRRIVSRMMLYSSSNNAGRLSMKRTVDLSERS